jgi:hypothetical protein
MKKSVRKVQSFSPWRRISERSMESVENGKRRHALPPALHSLDSDSRMFFERVLSVRKIQEFLFITKADLKTR